jgi:hypothetical protein
LQVVSSDPEAITVDREAWGPFAKNDSQFVMKLS